MIFTYVNFFFSTGNVTQKIRSRIKFLGNVLIFCKWKIIKFKNKKNNNYIKNEKEVIENEFFKEIYLIKFLKDILNFKILKYFKICKICWLKNSNF